MGNGGVKNYQKLRDVIYGRPLSQKLILIIVYLAKGWYSETRLMLSPVNVIIRLM